MFDGWNPTHLVMTGDGALPSSLSSGLARSSKRHLGGPQTSPRSLWPPFTEPEIRGTCGKSMAVSGGLMVVSYGFIG